MKYRNLSISIRALEYFISDSIGNCYVALYFKECSLRQFVVVVYSIKYDIIMALQQCK